MNNTAFLALLPLLVTTLAAGPQSHGSEETGSSQVAQLLTDTKSLASSLKSDLATLDFFALSADAGLTRTAMFNLYEEHINALRSQQAKLEAKRKDGSRWQQTALDRIVPIIEEFASSAEAAIAAAKTSQGRLNSADSRDYFKLNADLADEFSTAIGAWADYAKTRADLDRAAQKIR